MRTRFACLLVAFAAFGGGRSAWAAPPPALDTAARTRAIDGVLRRLRDGYVFPEVAEKMERAVRERAAAGAYDALADGEAFAAELTKDLRAVSRDRHIRVSFSAAVLPPKPAGTPAETPPPAEEMRRHMARDNFGLAKLDILKGNIGLLEFRYLAPPEFAADTYAGAMAYLANTDALILDLRACGGSISPDAIPMLCSYFFAVPTHLNDIYWRPSNSTRQFWTWAHVPGKRYLDRPIYVLTSRATFSGAEELAYDLQNLKRATVIGETTGGGANPGGDQCADDHFRVWVPTGRAINPTTKTNWEGTGVTPDVKAPAAGARHRAHVTALRQLLPAAEEGPWKEQLKAALAEAERNAPRLRKVTFSLKGHPQAGEVGVAGTFNAWNPSAHPLTRCGDAWVAEIEVEAGRHAYKFVVDGRWLADPENAETEGEEPFVNSVRRID